MKLRVILSALLGLSGPLLAEPAAGPLFKNSDFETGALENWVPEGEAFREQPTRGDNPAKRGRSDGSKHRGEYWIGTFEAYTGRIGSPGKAQGDGMTGRLTSVEFPITRRYLNFLVGAGAHPETSVRLLVDGKTWLLSSGFESESMKQVSADVKAFQGKKAKLVLLDNVTGGWGHLNADDFTASDKPLGQLVKPVETKRANLKKSVPGGGEKEALPLTGPEQSAELEITGKYLLLPIHNGAPLPKVALAIGGKPVRFFTAELAPAPDQVDWWAFVDVSEFAGKKATLTVSGLTGEGFKLIRQGDTVPGAEGWGDEALRPQFHFSQSVGWNNDPNGMVYYDGEWHLFLQHNPVGWKWGNMTWGHAVSRDLVHWTQLPNVLHHREDDAMFSGGGAVDWKNTGGWKTGANDVIFVAWTSTGRGECIAHSNDKGRTFTEFKGNPVITHKGRDPKPLWYVYGAGDKPLSDAAAKLGGHWVIAVFDEDPNVGRNVSFYTSIDLKRWDLQSQIPGYFECPELFPLPVSGRANETHWILFGADARYAVGRFDGRAFTPGHAGKHRLHWGSYYASQIFSDAPEGRRIQIGWARINMPGMPFNQTFSFPTELTLRPAEGGLRLCGEPVKEIEKIHGKKHEAAGQPLAPGQTVRLATAGALFDIRAVIEVGAAKRAGLRVDGKEVFAWDAAAGVLDNPGLKPVDGKISVWILIDRPMMETFVNDGQMVITDAYQNDLNIESIEAFAEGGAAKLVSLEAYELEAGWKQAGR